MDRNNALLVAAREEITTCVISGAVGTFTNIDPRVEEHVTAAKGTEYRTHISVVYSKGSPCFVFCRVRRNRLAHRAHRNRNTESSWHTSA